jgi:hypothetical protein
LLLASARFKHNSWADEDEGRWKKKKLTMLQETITRWANKALQKQRSLRALRCPESVECKKKY